MSFDVYTPTLFSAHNRLLHYAFVCAVVPWMYSYYNEQHRISSYSVEQAMLLAFDKLVSQPSIHFRKAVVGFNCNVDVIIPGTQLLEALNATTDKGSDHETLNDLNDLSETFLYSFMRGGTSERYMANEDTFGTVVKVAEKMQRMQYHIGGNAALMAEKIASSFPKTEVYLVGPIGPRSNALLHPSIKRTNSTRIVKDEVHVIMEYKQGEILGDHVAPSSSRFITSHDLFSGSTIVIDMFFKACSKFNPDLMILTGVHLLEFQDKEIRNEKLRLIKRNLLQISPKVPIHFELGSSGGDGSFILEVLYKVIPYIDSLGLTEQELALISHAAGGPFTEEYPVQAGTIHVHKVVDMLHWLLNYGRHKKDSNGQKIGYRLQRIHFKCLTYHIVVSVGTDWSNLASGLAAGARIAGRQACGMHYGLDTDLLELRSAQSYVLDKQQNKVYHFHAHNPVASWMRDDSVFIYTPVLVCKFPRKTVGVEDAISTTALLYSQFYKFDHVMY